MSASDEVGDFLTAHRARISPGQAGFPAYGDRRVAGLRREEVAELAGITVEYYSRLERGHTRGVSDEVWRSVARALQLGDTERAHLADLVRAASTPRPAGAGNRAGELRPQLQRLLDALAAPAYVWNGRLDVVGANPLGAALFAPVLDSAFGPPNLARYLFRDPGARDFFPEHEQLAHDAVAVLRAEAGRNPYDERLADLVRDLSGRSAEFRTMWAAYDVRTRRTGIKHFRHPVAGALTVTFESMALSDDPDLHITAGTAEPGSASEQALALLGSWTA